MYYLSAAHHTPSENKELQVTKGTIGQDFHTHYTWEKQVSNYHRSDGVHSCDHTFRIGAYSILSDSGKYNMYIIVDCPNPGICKMSLKPFFRLVKVHTTQVSHLWSQTHIKLKFGGATSLVGFPILTGAMRRVFASPVEN